MGQCTPDWLNIIAKKVAHDVECERLKQEREEKRIRQIVKEEIEAHFQRSLN